MKNNQNEKLEQPQETCPYLGLRNDPATYSAYPSGLNTCFHVEPSAIPKLSHQESFCLQPRHVACPVFTAPDGQKMAKNLQFQTEGLSSRTKTLIRVGAVIGVILVVLFVFLLRDLWLPNIGGIQNSTETALTQASSVQETLDALSLLGTRTTTSNPEGEGSQFPPFITTRPTQMSTETPSPTATLFTQSLALETPIGREYRFVIHRIQSGESMLLYANWYGTSPDAIMAVNVNLTYPIQIDELIVIPVDLTDVTGLPAFEPYEVKGLEIGVEELADKLSVSVEALIRYNNLTSGYVIQPGEWVLVPRENPES
jgi:LysM repeat protein